MKKILALFLATILVFSLAACGADKKDDEDKTADKIEDKETVEEDDEETTKPSDSSENEEKETNIPFEEDIEDTDTVECFACGDEVSDYVTAESGCDRWDLCYDCYAEWAEEVDGEDGEEISYITVSLSSDEVHTGNLILVNSSTEYLFPEDMEGDIVKIEDYKNGYYGTSAYSTAVELSRTVLEVFNVMTEDYYNETGFMWLQINSAYRSREAQESLYAEYVQTYGEDYAQAYVANPGESEHHTGLGIDLNVNRNGAISYVGTDAECEWFRENCQEYGFILRYPPDKVNITGIASESWHYRYVGTPHAQIMEDLSLCLEEYIDYVKDYTVDTTCIGFSEEDGVYETTAEEYYENGGIMIYYVPSEGETTEVQIPDNCEYTVSGNNADGFIITCMTTD